MIKYEIIRDVKAENLVQECVRFLESKKITSLPDGMVIGEIRNIFQDDNTRISLLCKGDREGEFVLSHQKGEYLSLLHSAKFRY